MEFSAKQIAEYIQGIIVGDENATVHTFAKIEEGVQEHYPFYPILSTLIISTIRNLPLYW